MLPFPCRAAVFGLLAIAGCEGLFRMVQQHGAAIGAENAGIETAQIVLAGLASALYLAAGGLSRRHSFAYYVGAALLVYAAGRESDQWFESMLFDDAYKIVVGIPVAIGLILAAYRHRRGLVRETWQSFDSRPSVLFITGGVLLVSVCQMFDRPGMWPEASYMQKCLIEECVELFAYGLLLFAAGEALLAAIETRRAETTVIPMGRPRNVVPVQRAA